MSITALAVTMDSNNELACAAEGGYSGEHNAQMLEITLNEEFAGNTYDYLTIAFDTGGYFGKSVSNEIRDENDAPVYRAGNKLYCTLVQALTSSGVLRIQISAHSESGGLVTGTKKSGILELSFKPSIAQPSLPVDLRADIEARLTATGGKIEQLATRITGIEENPITAGDYLTINESNEMNVVSSNIVGSSVTALATCSAVMSYVDSMIYKMLSQYGAEINSGVVTRLIKSMDPNCLDVFISTGSDAIYKAARSGLVDLMIYGENMQDKYILVAPFTSIENAQISETVQDYTAGNIYKVIGDSENYMDVITCYTEDDFAQLLNLGA